MLIPAEHYESIYLIVVAIITFIVGYNYSIKDSLPLQKESPLPSFVLLTAVTLFIGLRPLSWVFVDMLGYAGGYIHNYEYRFVFSFDRTNFLFDNLFSFMSISRIPVEWFFFIIAAIYFVSAYIACRKLFPNDTLLVFLMFLASFSTFSYGTNGIKAGAAASLFLVAVAYRDKLWVSIPMAIISLGFHHSMIMVICAYIVVLLYKNRYIYFAIWLVCLFMALTHISLFQNLFYGLADESGQGYLGSVAESGLRIDFIIYSAVPVLVGLVAIFKRGITSKMYTTMLNLYLLTNSIWMLCMYASFTNRIAYLSWFLYPFVLIYPFLNEDWSPVKYKSARLVAYWHLAFTLFMTFVYYGIFNMHH